MRPSDDVLGLLDALLALAGPTLASPATRGRERDALIDQHADLAAVVADWHRERYGEEPPWLPAPIEHHEQWLDEWRARWNRPDNPPAHMGSVPGLCDQCSALGETEQWVDLQLCSACIQHPDPHLPVVS